MDLVYLSLIALFAGLIAALAAGCSHLAQTRGRKS